MSIYDAAMRYQADRVPLVVIAGQEYGTGSSRDWAAKGTSLLGVKAVIAGSFERIHRSNLVGMGVLPLQFREGTNAQTLKLDGTETYSVLGLGPDLAPRQDLTLLISRRDANTVNSPNNFITVSIRSEGQCSENSHHENSLSNSACNTFIICINRFI